MSSSQQFLIESRELVDQASDDLLALEKAPHDAQRFDDAFRAFHTLKGGAGIVDFAAMQEARALPRRVRSRQRARESRPLSALDIGNCLVCLDQVVDWLDTIESTGDAPAGRRRRLQSSRASRARRSRRRERCARPLPPAMAGSMRWLARMPPQPPQAQTALRYRPPADSFFRQQDPARAHRRAAGPARHRHRAARSVAAARRARPVLLQSRDHGAARSLARGRGGGARRRAAPLRRRGARDRARCRREGIACRARSRAARSSAAIARRRPASARRSGHIASAGLVAANVLRHLGRTAEADAVAAEAAAAVAEGGPRRLRASHQTAVARGRAERAAAQPSLPPHAAATAARRRCA